METLNLNIKELQSLGKEHSLVLAFIRQWTGHRFVHECSATTTLTQVTINKTLKELEAKGYITIVKVDGRGKAVPSIK